MSFDMSFIDRMMMMMMMMMMMINREMPTSGHVKFGNFFCDNVPASTALPQQEFGESLHAFCQPFRKNTTLRKGTKHVSISPFCRRFSLPKL